VAVFTNLSQDHLDLHGTMEEYAKTKLQLFTKLSYADRKKGVKKVGVVNMDDPYSKDFLEATVDTMFTFGKNPSAQIRPQNVVQDENGMHFQVKMPAHTLDISTSLIGEFNVYNILAAVGVLVSQKISPEAIAESVGSLHGIDGRMQEIYTNLGCKIYVDYAHTEESLRQVLTTLQGIRKPEKRIIVVFGATGDRDTDKRPKMGAVVDELADLVILTEDDNYTEDQFSIMNQVSQGIKRREGENFWIIFHREDAIRTALLSANEGDIILLAGKGSEKVIVRNSGSEPWSDAEVARNIAQEIEMNRI
jgi:UDP-N-acetylmuramyl-tripeptide synthetase